MANVLGELFQDIADAIREKTGGSGKMKPMDFPLAIASIEAGGGSGGELVVKKGTFTTSNTNEYTINHGLGVVPFAFFIQVRNPTSAGKVGDSKLFSAFGISKEICDTFGVTGFANYLHYSSYSPIVRGWSYNPSGAYLDNATNNSDVVLNSATETSIIFGSSSYRPASGAEYSWIAFGIK